jgi:hypothetical protein
MALVAVAVLQGAWLVWFLLEPLPNAGNVGGKGLNRLLLLIRAVPEVMVPGLRYRDSYLGLALAELSHVENLPQRLPIVLAAGFIAASAVSLGLLVLRGLRLRSVLEPWERLAVGYGLGTTGLGLATLIVGRLGGLHPWPIRIGLTVPVLVELAAWFFGQRRDSVSRRVGGGGGGGVGRANSASACNNRLTW